MNLKQQLTSTERFNLHSRMRQKQIEQSLNFYVKNGEMYDTRTGEYIGDKYQLPQWLQPIRHQQQNEHYKQFQANDNAIRQHTIDNGGFVWCLFNSMDRFKNLNKKDIARLLYLAIYVNYTDGILKKGDGTKITTDTVHTLIKMSKKRGKEFIHKLVNEQIIQVDDDQQIYMNPKIFFKGEIDEIKKVDKDLRYIRLFRNTVRQIFENAKENELAHIATIYSVLPYINLNHNYICHNPKEEDVQQIKMIDTKTLSNKLNYNNYSKMMSQLRKLTVNGEPVFNFFDDVKDARRKCIVVNPSVVYAGNNAEHLEVLKGMFIKK